MGIIDNDDQIVTDNFKFQLNLKIPLGILSVALYNNIIITEKISNRNNIAYC